MNLGAFFTKILIILAVIILLALPFVVEFLMFRREKKEKILKFQILKILN